VTSSALVIGVPGPVSFHHLGRTYRFGRLQGVANDVAWYQRFLSDRLGGPDHVQVLQTPAQTSAVAIRTALRGCVASLGSGDLFVLVVTGHGMQVVDAEGEEPDGLDEAIVATDAPVLDDFFRQLWASNAQDYRVIEFIDTCNADSVGLAIRYDDTPEQVVVHHASAPSRLAFGASLAGEDARETDRLGGRRGVLSAALERAWATPANRESYRAWFETAAIVVRNWGAVQHPRLRYLGPDPAMVDQPPFR
jgi:hypothetical protein